MLAVVVDDHDMEISHVIRGDDHLRNALRQVPIYEAMGWPVPVFAHVPLIHGSDGKKLSKRHGALSTLAYRDEGYLPEAVSAYLTRLGWSQGDKDIFTRDEAIAAFTLEGINKAPARLDLDKLADVSRHFMRLADEERLFEAVRPWLERERVLAPAQVRALRAALPELKTRAATLPALADACAFIVQPRPFDLNKKARKALRGEGLERLAALRDYLAALDGFTSGTLQVGLESYCTAQGLAIKDIGPPLRAALTGGLPAPDLAPVMAWLGREEVLSRIDERLALERSDPDA